MALSLSDLNSTTAVKPPHILLYGVHGVGKTTFGASAPNPVFLQTEDGLRIPNIPSFGLLDDYTKLMEAITALATEDHNFQTLVMDSVDWAETMVWKEVCKENGWNSIEDPGYGKGYVVATQKWRELLTALDYLRNTRNMTTIMIAHAQVKRFDDPATEPYDRYGIKLHKGASALLEEFCDCVFFANYQVSTKETDSGFGKKRTRAVGGGTRVLYTEERPAFVAKNRFMMPAQTDLTWSAVAPFFTDEHSAKVYGLTALPGQTDSPSPSASQGATMPSSQPSVTA